MNILGKKEEYEDALQRLRVENYKRIVHLYQAMEDYEKSEKKSEEQLLYFSELYKDDMLPLPSGNLGNPFALALEMNQFHAALLMLKNHRKIGLDLEKVTYSPDMNTYYNGMELYDYTIRCLSHNFHLYSEFSSIKKLEQDNMEAAVKVGKELNSFIKK